VKLSSRNAKRLQKSNRRVPSKNDMSLQEEMLSQKRRREEKKKKTNEKCKE